MIIFLNEGNLKKFKEDLDTTIDISLDIETNSLDVFTSKWILLQLKFENTTYILEVYRALPEFTKEVVSLLKDSNKLIIAHNAKFDTKTIFVKTGIMFTNFFDTMLVETLLTRGIGKDFYSLQDLVWKYCAEDILKEERENFINFSGIVTQEMILYAARDVEYLKAIAIAQYDLVCNNKLEKVFELEMKLIPVVSNMEINGVLLNENRWRELEIIAREKLAILKEKLLDYFVEHLDSSKSSNAYEFSQRIKIPVKRKKDIALLTSITDLSAIKSWTRDNINLNSHAQLKAILNRIGIKISSTNEKVLKDYSKSSEAIDLLLQYREQAKKISSFGEKFLNHIHSETKRIHSDFNQLGTVSGRFSSSKPNLQQLPKEKEYREAFIAREGYKLLTFDYDQVEYRLAGAIGGEKVIIQAYLDGKDMHTRTAELLGVERARAKNINFGILYGSTDRGLSYNLGVPLDKAKEMLYNFKRGYPTLMKFKDTVERAILKKKYSITPLGRKRFFEQVIFYKTPNDFLREQGRLCREGFNHIIQGCAADILKQAMINIYYENPFGEDLKVLMQIHDELVFEVKNSLEKEAAQFIKEKMLEVEQPYLGEIPSSVNYCIADYWSK